MSNQAGLSKDQANRLREDIKRGAHIHRIIELTTRHVILDIELLKIELTLAREEYDAIGNDLEGMLLANGNGKNKEE